MYRSLPPNTPCSSLPFAAHTVTKPYLDLFALVFQSVCLPQKGRIEVSNKVLELLQKLILGIGFAGFLYLVGTFLKSELDGQYLQRSKCQLKFSGTPIHTHGPWELGMFSNVPLSTANNVKTRTEANPQHQHFHCNYHNLCSLKAVSSFFPGTQQKNSLQEMFFYFLQSLKKHYCV